MSDLVKGKTDVSEFKKINPNDSPYCENKKNLNVHELGRALPQRPSS